jgi:predicted RNase H-like nuclease (RuvC/YqgF family)
MSNVCRNHIIIEAKNINQELKVQLNDLRADVASKDKTIALLTEDKNTLQASLDVSQQKQTELQGRLDKIAKYEKLLLSGNIEKIKTENMTETQKKFVSKMIPSVLKAYARKALERRLEKSKRWNVEGNKATLKWNY